jgi:beta-lactamase regulating signal transducer with metallopeptidase domain
MIVASTLVALPLLAIALIARRLRSDLEEAAWRLMVVAMLVTPIVTLLPKFDIGIRLPFVSAAPVLSLRQPELPTDSRPPILAVVYAVVAIALLTRLILSVIAARKLRRNAAPFGHAYVSPALRVPVTAGIFAPAVLLPADARTWSATKLAAVLAHERSHVTRRDPLWRFVGRTTTAIFWFHPLAWLAAASIERIAEETADRDAVAVLGDRHEYANVLLDLLRAMTCNGRRVLAAGILDGHPLDARIDAILQPAQTRRSRAVTRLLLASLVAAAIFITGMTKQEAPREDAAHRIARLEQQRRSDKEFFRARGEMRKRFRETVRNTMRGLFGGFDFD